MALAHRQQLCVQLWRRELDLAHIQRDLLAAPVLVVVLVVAWRAVDDLLLARGVAFQLNFDWRLMLSPARCGALPLLNVKSSLKPLGRGVPNGSSPTRIRDGPLGLSLRR